MADGVLGGDRSDRATISSLRATSACWCADGRDGLWFGPQECWTIAEHRGAATPDGLQHLLARASWDADAVSDDLRDYVIDAFGDPGAILAVHETGNVKKGTATVGVQRQYSSTAGRIENSQVAVYLTYAAPRGHALPFIKAAIAAGKDVYSEWPLSTTTAASEELLRLAEAKGVRHVIGLQRRLGPSVRYARDLVRQGYVGRLRGARISVGTDAFPPVMSERFSWTFDVSSFTNVLSIYAGHHLDTLFEIVRRPTQLSAITESQFAAITVEETGEQVPNHNPNEVMVIGTLDGGGLFSAQLEGGQAHPTGLQIDITGTDGVLRLTNEHAFQNPDDNTVQGVTGDETSLTTLTVPDKYRQIPEFSLDESAADVAHLYATYAQDRANGTWEAPSFKDAVRQHELIDQVEGASREFFG